MICVLQPYLKFLFDEFSISRFTLQFLSEPPGYANAWEFERNEKVAMVARRNLHISYLFRPLGVTAMNYGDITTGTYVFKRNGESSTLVLNPDSHRPPTSQQVSRQSGKARRQQNCTRGLGHGTAGNGAAIYLKGKRA